jgi:hypothetical protein
MVFASLLMNGHAPLITSPQSPFEKRGTLSLCYKGEGWGGQNLASIKGEMTGMNCFSLLLTINQDLGHEESHDY